MSRFAYHNPEIPKRLAKRLRTILARHGVDKTLSACQETVARMLGFDDVHSMLRQAPGLPPGIYDVDCAFEEVRRRRARQTAALMRAGVPIDLADTVLVLLRPTDVAPREEGLDDTDPVVPGPWGDILSETRVADGIHAVKGRFASGFRVSRERGTELSPAVLPEPDANGDHWFQDGLEAVLLPACFPDLFDEDEIRRAGRETETRYPGLMDAVSGDPLPTTEELDRLRPDRVTFPAPEPNEFYKACIRGTVFRWLVDRHGPRLEVSRPGGAGFRHLLPVDDIGAWYSDVPTGAYSHVQETGWFIGKYDPWQAHVPLVGFGRAPVGDGVADFAFLDGISGAGIGCSRQGSFWRSEAAVALSRAVKERPDDFRPFAAFGNMGDWFGRAEAMTREEVRDIRARARRNKAAVTASVDREREAYRRRRSMQEKIA